GRTGQGRRVGDNLVGGHRDEVATGVGQVTHGGDHRTAGLPEPYHLSADRVAGDVGATGGVDPQHHGTDVVVAADCAQLGTHGVGSGLGALEGLPLPGAGDDRA